MPDAVLSSATQIKRPQFEALCSDLFERVAAPIHQALAAAEMRPAELDQIIIIGGGVRSVLRVGVARLMLLRSIPKIQEILLQSLGIQELGKNLNGDEAAALGLLCC